MNAKYLINLENCPNMLDVKTTQRTPVFYLFPEGGWKRGVVYSELNDNFHKHVQSKLPEGVQMQPEDGRYLAYYFEVQTISSTGVKDSSIALQTAVQILLNSLNEFNVLVRTNPSF